MRKHLREGETREVKVRTVGLGGRARGGHDVGVKIVEERSRCSGGGGVSVVAFSIVGSASLSVGLGETVGLWQR
jgi:hypothetical protein